MLFRSDKPPADKAALEQKIAEAVLKIKEAGVQSDDGSNYQVLWADIKDVVDSQTLKALKTRGNITFAGSTLDDDAILTFAP